MCGSTYRLISSDGHIVEPPDVWVDRVPAKYRDRCPRIERFPEGDAWIIEGVNDPVNFGWNACAGNDPKSMNGWARHDELRRGCYDPAARLDEQDEDGVDGEVLYPTPRLSQAIFANRDVDFHVACVQAYNDWMSEFAAYAPDRFCGVILLPNHGADLAVRRVRSCVGPPRHAHCGDRRVSERHARGDSRRRRALGPPRRRRLCTEHPREPHAEHAVGPSFGAPGYGRFFDAPNRIVQMVFAGVFDRFPSLNLVIAEVDIGWVPYYKEQIDNNYHRLAPANNYALPKLPSEYVEQHVHFTYMTDSFGLQNRHEVGVENILWSSDYPHISADWPYSWRTIQSSMAGIRVTSVISMLAGNAQRLYKFGQ